MQWIYKMGQSLTSSTNIEPNGFTPIHLIPRSQASSSNIGTKPMQHTFPNLARSPFIHSDFMLRDRRRESGRVLGRNDRGRPSHCNANLAIPELSIVVVAPRLHLQIVRYEHIVVTAISSSHCNRRHRVRCASSVRGVPVSDLTNYTTSTFYNVTQRIFPLRNL